MRFWKLSAIFLAACAAAPATRTELIPADLPEVPHAAQYRDIDKSGPPPESAVHVVKSATGEKLANGEKELTPEFPAIDSFDVSQTRKEVVFSAKRGDNFDVGLVSVDGSDIHWIPSDPADEVSVRWAPRGNKVSYVIRERNGDVVRVVHVITSARFLADFPYGHVVATAWDADGERYSVSWESADASQRVESIAWDGRDRRMEIAPGARLTGVATELSGGVLIIRPEAMHYGEKLPLVVWRTTGRNLWSDARAQLQRENRVACAIIDRDPDDAFWADMHLHPWIDLTRVFVVNAPAPPGGTSIRGIVGAESGRVRIEGNSLLVPVDVVESFAAGTITRQLKGSPPAHGRNR
jgi:hypothetical protein